MPLGCTSLVVSQHFSEFLYGIYWWALAPVYVFAGDTVRDLKISLKKCKKSRKNKEIACPVNFWNKKKCAWCVSHNILVPQKNHYCARVFSQKKFFPEVGIRNFMTKSTRGGVLGEFPPSGVQNSDLDGFDVACVFVMSIIIGVSSSKFP